MLIPYLADMEGVSGVTGQAVTFSPNLATKVLSTEIFAVSW